MNDYIDRQAAIKAVSSMFAPTPTQKDMVEDCLETIENLPLVEVEPVKHGRWENGRCSICKAEAPYTEDGFWEETAYCPHCGAKMQAKEEG